MSRRESLLSNSELRILDAQCAYTCVRFDHVLGSAPTPYNLFEPDEQARAYSAALDEAENQMIFAADARASADLAQPEAIDTIRWAAVAHRMVKKQLGRNYASRSYFTQSPDNYFTRVVEANLANIQPFGAAMNRDYRYARLVAAGAITLRSTATVL